MKCPECGNKLKVPDIPVMNMESYHRSVKSITLCCRKIVLLHPEFSYSVEKLHSQPARDDWGMPGKTS